MRGGARRVRAPPGQRVPARAPAATSGSSPHSGERTADDQPRAWLAALVEHVGPGERVGLAGAEALVGEHADEGGVLGVELAADQLDRLGCACVDRLGTGVGEPPCSHHRVPGQPACGVRKVGFTLPAGAVWRRASLRGMSFDNLYVVDTSVFPSIGVVNPALAAMANSPRVGDQLLERLR